MKTPENDSLRATSNTFETHKDIVKNVILHYANLVPRGTAIEIKTSFDEANNQYMLWKTGWQKGREINDTLILVHLVGKGIEIKIDKTRNGIVKDLIKHGVIKDYISLPRKNIFNILLDIFIGGNQNNQSLILAPNSIKSGKFYISIMILFFLTFVGVILALILRYRTLFYTLNLPVIIVFITFGGILGLVTWAILDNLPDQLTYVSESSYQEALNRIIQSPDKVKSDWDMTNAIFIAYLNRSLKQIDWIFRFSVIVMLSGLGLVGASIALAYYQKGNLALIIVGSITGGLTQVMSVIFLFIYRSTIIQYHRKIETLTTNSYIRTAMQILDGIDEEHVASTDKLVDIKMEIVKSLLANAQEIKKLSINQSSKRQQRLSKFSTS